MSKLFSKALAMCFCKTASVKISFQERFAILTLSFGNTFQSDLLQRTGFSTKGEPDKIESALCTFDITKGIT
jgi:hypothetical protein